jgi:glycosyltransferase involved in cell wall biosynthesis
MKVLLISTSLEGGAGGSAYRLHQSLQNLGMDSQILVQTKSGDDEAVITVPKHKLVKKLSKLKSEQRLDSLPLKFYPNRDRSSSFSLQWFPAYPIPSKVAQLNPDIINLRWTCASFLQIESIPKLNKPLVWTLSDMWAFTGGCHYSQHCDRYTDSCGACPQLGSTQDCDLSRWVWQRKAKAWKNLNLTVVTPSSWLAKCASSSSFFKDRRVEVIPTAVDTKKYQPTEQQIARKLLNLPQYKQLILFGAWGNSHRKGFHLLQPALQNLSKSGCQDNTEVITFGFSQPSEQLDLGFKSHYLGKLNDAQSLALAYSAADVFVAPSMQDNLPNTVLEAIACGTPCVAFKVGGMPDVIEHQQNGYLAQPYSIEDLAQGIAWILKDRDRLQKLSYSAREKAEREFTLEQYARKYKSLFNEILESQNGYFHTKKLALSR